MNFVKYFEKIVKFKEKTHANDNLNFLSNFILRGVCNIIRNNIAYTKFEKNLIEIKT